MNSMKCINKSHRDLTKKYLKFPSKKSIHNSRIFHFFLLFHIIFINFTWAICAFVPEQFKNEANFPFYSNSIINLVCHLSYVFLPAIYFTHHINMLPYKYIYFHVMYAGQISVCFWCIMVGYFGVFVSFQTLRASTK